MTDISSDIRIANSAEDIFTRLAAAHRRVYREEGVENSRNPAYFLLPAPIGVLYLRCYFLTDI
jgi:hypothetical protein